MSTCLSYSQFTPAYYLLVFLLVPENTGALLTCRSSGVSSVWPGDIAQGRKQLGSVSQGGW